MNWQAGVGWPDVLVLDSLNVEADGGDGGDNLTKFQFVQDRCLPCCTVFFSTEQIFETKFYPQEKDLNWQNFGK